MSTLTLTGPLGTFQDGTRITHSRIRLLSDRWQWVAQDAGGAVITVVEMGWLTGDARLPSTPDGALWVLREIAANYLRPVRSIH